MSNGVFGFFMMGVIFVLLSVPFALGVNILAEKLGENRWTWTILMLIPGLNIIFSFYVTFHVVFHVIDSLKAVRAAVGPLPGAVSPSEPA
jgi:hypothetical protein